MQTNQKIVFLEKFVREVIYTREKQILEEQKQEKREKERLEKINLEKLKQKIIYPRMKLPLIRRRNLQDLVRPIGLRRVPSFVKKNLIQLKKIIPQPQLIQQAPLVMPDTGAQLPQGFSLGRIDVLIKDNAVTMIECPGPDKQTLVKKAGQINMTNISLTEKEIKDIIDSFSKSAKIPVLGGLLKAAVGNLIISAVVSEFVGSRFIINKNVPYSLIEKNQQSSQLPPQSTPISS